MRSLARLRPWLPTVELGLAALAAALWYRGGGAVWYRGGGLTVLPLLVLGTALALRLLDPRPVRIAAQDALLALFVVSALLSAFVAYDRERAFAKFGLILGAAGLCAALAHQPDSKRLYVALAGLGGLGLALSLYFVAVYDWSAGAKMPLLAHFGGRLAAALPRLEGHAITPNVAGGMLSVLLPFCVPLAAIPLQGGLGLARGAARVLGGAWLLAGLVAGLGLVLSASRGAWAATAGALGLWVVWRGLGALLAGRGAPAPQARSERSWRARIAAMALLLLAAALVAGLLGLRLLTAGGLLAAALRNRLVLVQRAASLARDYAFTGLGLGMFEMHFSVYTLLIHVGYIVNSHNALLDVAIEQGLPGLTVLLGLLGTAMARALGALRGAAWGRVLLMEAALASTCAGLLHGLVDDVLYGSRGVLIWFVGLGVIAAVAGWGMPAGVVGPVSHRWNRRAALAGAAAALVATVALVVGGSRPVRAAWQANLGGIAQARTELNAYDQWHFDNPTLDQVRQRADLERPLERFSRALALSPGQRTASQRLGAIALARGDYVVAQRVLDASWEAGHRDAVTRLLRGDALVAGGRPAEAAELVRGLPYAKERLQGQAWSRYERCGDWVRAADAWAAVACLDPGDASAVAAEERARRNAEKR